MAYNCSNIFQNPGIKNSPEKGRYSDPSIPGMGSPYNKRGCSKSNYKQTGPQVAAFGPNSELAEKDPARAKNILQGIASSPNSQVIPAIGPNRGLNKSVLNTNNQTTEKNKKYPHNVLGKKPMKKEKPCDCPKDLDNCNCE